jgi:hypothetical protein
VDVALPLGEQGAHKNVYYCALELNGTGIRFYGDVSLVLRETAPDTVILDRNSWDVERAPIRPTPAKGEKRDDCEEHTRRKKELGNLAGIWGQSLADMAVVKVMDHVGPRSRRLTTGEISEAILDDEDYMEVLRRGSFCCEDLHEARLSSADAAHDAQIAARLRRGPTPRYEALLWYQRRRRAEAALRKAGVPVTIITTQGRTR